VEAVNAVVVLASAVVGACLVGISAVALHRERRTGRRLADAHQLDEAKSRLMRLTAHELRGPLTVIGGFVGFLRDERMTDVQRCDTIDLVDTQLYEANRIIDQVLDAARLEDGRLELSCYSIDLRDVVREAVDQARVRITRRHSLDSVIPDEVVMIEGDHNRLVTVVSNLLGNAVKYSPDGGEVHCALAVADGSAMVAVTDEGVGIDPVDVPRLFTRFARVGINHNIPGAGLGLYLSRELARLHGGEITVSSIVGAGSCFSLRLPMRARQHPAPLPALTQARQSA
jgi:signal transduction histidine kinase